MPDPEFVKWLATLGVGGVLAAFMFWFYRKDVKMYTELWQAQTDILMMVIRENTASNIKLIALIEMMDRRSNRRHGDVVE